MHDEQALVGQIDPGEGGGRDHPEQDVGQTIQRIVLEVVVLDALRHPLQTALRSLMD